MLLSTPDQQFFVSQSRKVITVVHSSVESSREIEAAAGLGAKVYEFKKVSVPRKRLMEL